MSRIQRTFKITCINHMEGQKEWSLYLPGKLEKIFNKLDKRYKLYFHKLDPRNIKEEKDAIIKQSDFIIFKLFQTDKNTKLFFKEYIQDIDLTNTRVLIVANYGIYSNFLQESLSKDINYTILSNLNELIEYMIGECIQ